MKKILIPAIVLSSVGLLVFIYKNLKLSDVSCQSQYGPCSEEVQSIMSSNKDKNIFVAYSSIRSELSKHPHVANFSLKFDTLNKLQSSIHQRKAEVAIKAEGDTDYYFYSSDGFQISKQNETLLPVVVIKDNSIATREQELSVIRMAYVLNQTYNVKQMEVAEGGLKFKTERSPQIIFPLTGDEDVLLGGMTFVLSQLNTQLEDFRMESIESIDFRFRNPVIRKYE